ncbi:sensor histidine kinase [Corynebacterium renale]|uniref:sensor histidine kinase n=1 Tax=Corynebacterium renale TaxID=1724 RepID=UPI000DBE5228|nr:histidine kinase [Corynebacterium renale]
MRWRRKNRDYEELIKQLVLSQRALVRAYEVERRRIERDLHDGAQQYLVSAALKIGEAQLSATGQQAELLAEARDALQRSLESLRATVRGIHPRILHERGLVAALEDACDSAYVQIKCPLPIPDVPEGVLATAYFFTLEAVTNARKYAPDSGVEVLIAPGDVLYISVVDHGNGGARIVPDGGLDGMRERLHAVGGTMELYSPEGGPTRIVATIPLLLLRNEPGVVL